MSREFCSRVHRPGSRSGFTLLELLIVMGIISILLALGAAVYQQVVVTQQASVTELLLSKLSSELKNQITAAVDKAKNEKIPPEITALAGNDTRVAKVLWIKIRVRKEFPMTFAEAGMVPDNLSSIKPVATYVQVMGANAPNQSGDNSSACLLMALKQNRRGMTFDPEVSLGAQATRIRPSDGYAEIIDGWGTPIVFNRSVTGAESTSGRGNDPYDPEKVFGRWAANLSGTDLANVGNAIGYNPAAVAGQITVDYGPSIISAGRDGQAGTPATDADNIESRVIP